MTEKQSPAAPRKRTEFEDMRSAFLMLGAAFGFIVGTAFGIVVTILSHLSR
jgi:hypothetical protein